MGQIGNGYNINVNFVVKLNTIHFKQYALTYQKTYLCDQVKGVYICGEELENSSKNMSGRGEYKGDRKWVLCAEKYALVMRRVWDIV